MKQILLTIITLSTLSFSQLKADEGMWLLPLINKLNIDQMQKMGLQLSSEDIYNINHNSLKDAVVMFGNYCTGEMISDQGLLLTNHHCGFKSIQSLSSVNANYLENGFWAYKQEDEIPIDGLTITFMKSMVDVTQVINESLSDTLKADEREKAILTTKDSLIKQATEFDYQEAIIKDFYNGNQQFLIIYEKYKDVRFVGAPPSSIGKFGHDTDNWMWPRHTGDFCLFRVYADQEGKPTEYSTDNIPLKPKQHLPISIKGIQENDFAMTIGYPGSTYRYDTSYSIKERMNIINKSRIEPREIKQNIWHEDMMADEKIRIQYASKFSRSSNYWKNSIGMNRGIKKLNVIQQKENLEFDFNQWVQADSTNKELYGTVLQNMKEAYEGRQKSMNAKYYLIECLLRGTEILDFSLEANDLYNILESKNQTEIDSAIHELKSIAHDFYKDYNPPTDKKVMAALLKTYDQNVDEEHLPDFYFDIFNKYRENYSKYVDDIFKKSIFSNKDAFYAFLEAPSAKILLKDPILNAGSDTYNMYIDINSELSESKRILTKNKRLYIEGLLKKEINNTHYPDANFTMRLSYGKVGGYKARDAVFYNYFTTLTGIIEKEDPDNYEFIVPEKLKELFQNKDYGVYANNDGAMPVCFITDNDITGGNSGSPVINGNGELIGLAFDGNWEAMSGDIAFENNLQRCINVDIRYVLFIIDKYANAQNLIDELTIVN